MPAYKDFGTGSNESNPVAYDISSRDITLPAEYSIKRKQLEEYCGALKSILNKSIEGRNMEPYLLPNLDGKKVLITGGLGFIGSNLVHKFHDLGAEVTIYDSFDPKSGGNLFNVNSIKNSINIVY